MDGMEKMREPTKKYQVIYCDPAWQYKSKENVAKKSTLTGKNNFHYPTMSKQELQDMKPYIDDITDNNHCLIYMWVVSPLLDEGLELLKHWGFKYCTVAFIWNKVIPNMGHYTMGQGELCLVGKRGIIPNRNNRNTKQWYNDEETLFYAPEVITEKKTHHSTKPSQIRDRIYDLHKGDETNFLEMFSRNVVEGWDNHGNQI